MTPAAGGSITGPRIACGGEGGRCSRRANPDEEITLTAIADEGHAFHGWTGACAAAGTAPTCDVTLRGAVAVSALFEPAVVLPEDAEGSPSGGGPAPSPARSATPTGSSGPSRRLAHVGGAGRARRPAHGRGPGDGEGARARGRDAGAGARRVGARDRDPSHGARGARTRAARAHGHRARGTDDRGRRGRRSASTRSDGVASCATTPWCRAAAGEPIERVAASDGIGGAQRNAPARPPGSRSPGRGSRGSQRSARTWDAPSSGSTARRRA